MRTSYAFGLLSVCMVLFMQIYVTAGEEKSSAETEAAVTEETLKEGKELFAQNCYICHPKGRNIINPEKTLRRADLKENGITTPDDIVHIMRNPGPGMRVFTRDALPDHDARKIALYILHTYQ